MLQTPDVNSCGKLGYPAKTCLGTKTRFQSRHGLKGCDLPSPYCAHSPHPCSSGGGDLCFQSPLEGMRTGTGRSLGVGCWGLLGSGEETGLRRVTSTSPTPGHLSQPGPSRRGFSITLSSGSACSPPCWSYVILRSPPLSPPLHTQPQTWGGVQKPQNWCLLD